MTNRYKYILVECTPDDEPVEVKEVTEEILHLYTMIDYQEKIISSYRREFLPELFPEEQQLVRH